MDEAKEREKRLFFFFTTEGTRIKQQQRPSQKRRSREIGKAEEPAYNTGDSNHNNRRRSFFFFFATQGTRAPTTAEKENKREVKAFCRFITQGRGLERRSRLEKKRRPFAGFPVEHPRCRGRAGPRATA
jgi:hypothetical protein